ncbi:MAG: APC family permease [Propionibacteriaceae bacterium]|jgi:amino acid transporter|nr:APC family permease [Propionibacteriaceae bacterium]
MGVADVVKRILVGRKLKSNQTGHTLLSKRIALPIFASDALSSVAYAPDEIILTLSLSGMAGLAFDWKVGLMVAFVMFIVVMSYRQTVHAYPNGGGDYEVATANFGQNAGLVVASALLVDYVMTVAVSVSSGIQNAKSMITWLQGHEGVAAAVVIVVIMAINLRGVKDSGRFFAIPTYVFMISVLGTAAWGMFRHFVLGADIAGPMASYNVVADPKYVGITGLAMVALVARSFSSGCAALTGVEAISNGVPNFKPPKSKNAATTLAMLGSISILMLMGIMVLAQLTGTKIIDPSSGTRLMIDGRVVQVETPTVMAQLAQGVWHDAAPIMWVVVLATMVVLFLAANTAFNGFPTLGSVLARDGFLPRALYTRGDRLAYSNGIIMLGLAATALVLIFNASVTALIQLYVVGVFVSFTVSQTGMLRHWTRLLKTETDPAVRARMQRSRVINAVGLTCTAIVLVVVLVSKFIRGAYLAIIAMAVVFFVMKAIHRHYQRVKEEMRLTSTGDTALPSRVRAVVWVTDDVNKPLVRAVAFARGMRLADLEAVVVSVDPKQTEQVVQEWEAQSFPIPLKVLASPYREVTGPLVSYIRSIRTDNPRDVICVFIPELVVSHWWEQVLHDQTPLMVKARLHFMSGIMVISVPYQVGSAHRALRRMRRIDPYFMMEADVTNSDTTPVAQAGGVDIPEGESSR